MSRPIRILYDEWGFQETHGGVSRLFSEVMKNLPEGFEWKLTMCCTVNEYLKRPPFNLPSAKLTLKDFVRTVLRGHYFPSANRLYRFLAKMFPGTFPAHEVINRKVRYEAFKKGDFDIYHVVAHDWEPVVGRKPLVATVCDLIPELISKDEGALRYGRRLARAVTHYIAISECTKKDLMRVYHVPEEKISVVYLGYNMKNAQGNIGNLPNDILNAPYVLYVGKRAGYKNFDWMIRALSPLMKNDGGIGRLKVFCTGVPFNEEEKALFRTLGIADRVLQRFVTDDEMQFLFEHAVCFIYPSLYEGFGIPILDAFASKCPAVVANASCFPEVAGNAALFFDPRGNGEDLRSHVVKLADWSGVCRATLIQRGLVRVKMFSWEKCARETAQVYTDILRDWS